MFKKKFLPIEYSDKTINMLKDVGITNCIDLRNFENKKFSTNDFIYFFFLTFFNKKIVKYAYNNFFQITLVN